MYKFSWKSEDCGDTGDGICVEGHKKATESAGISGVDWNSFDFYSLPNEYIFLPISNANHIPQSL